MQILFNFGKCLHTRYSKIDMDLYKSRGNYKSNYGTKVTAIAGIGRRGLSDRLTLTRWRNAISRVARATN